MAGDAALGITPVMKWNFERSCYRWLVTRHPAQFERMDFTAQILQSASRARKAFYECGWAEAKVLIRPSDGKFERTPFFDTIIRRGLRNSTRFDASTLTEEEIEALGMHRDETLGFKLQIRQFRNSSRKELPPLGRGGGAGRLRSSTSSGAPTSADSDPKVGAVIGSIATAGASSATASAGAGLIKIANDKNSSNATDGVSGRTSHSLSAVRTSTSGGGDVGGGGGARCGDARASPDESAHRGRAPGCWGGDGGRIPASGRGWPDEAMWPNCNRSTETSGRRDGWTPTENMARWNFRRGGGSASNDQRECYADNNDDTRYPENGMSTPMAMPPWAHPPVAAPTNGGSRHPWQGPPARAWSCVDGSERHYRPPMGMFGGSRGDSGGDVERCRPGSREGDPRDSRGGSDVPVGNLSKSLGRQTEAEIRTSFRRQVVGQLAERPIGRAVAVPHRLSGGGGGEALNNPEPADGSLLTQGYLRLAAMNQGGEGGDDARRAIMNSSVPRRYEVPESGIGGAKPGTEGLGGRRPAQTRPVVHYARPVPPGYASGVEDGPALKKRRSLDGVDAGGSAVGGVPQPENLAECGPSNSDAGETQPWSRGRLESTPPDPQGHLLARELFESERQLDLARHALDEAQAKFEEANRAHQMKREQVFAAAATDKQSTKTVNSLERCTSRDPPARTCEGRNDRRGSSAAGRLSQDRPATSPEPHRVSSPAPQKAFTTDCADEMREVKREAALLYGIARAPVPSAGSPPRCSAPAPAATSSGRGRTGPPAEPHRSTLSQKAPNHAPEGSPVRRSPPSPPSPLPNLARAVPSGFGGAREVEEGRQPLARGLALLGSDWRRGGNVRMRVGSPVNRGGVRACVFPPPALASHPSEAAAGSYAHRPIPSRGAVPQMCQAPGSPSASGETDSDHSDSTTGVGAAQDDVGSQHQHLQQEHRDLQGHKQRDAVQSPGFRHAPSRGRQHWGGRSGGSLLDGKGEASEGYDAPLARLAAVATAGAQ